LTDRQTSQLRGWIVGRDPRQFQLDFALWTRKLVGDLIRRKFDVETRLSQLCGGQGPGLLDFEDFLGCGWSG